MPHPALSGWLRQWMNLDFKPQISRKYAKCLNLYQVRLWCMWRAMLISSIELNICVSPWKFDSSGSLNGEHPKDQKHTWSWNHSIHVVFTIGSRNNESLHKNVRPFHCNWSFRQWPSSFFPAICAFVVKTSDVSASGQVSNCVHRLPNSENTSFCLCQCLPMLVYGCLCLVVANCANSGVDMGNVE